jgi:hypothetical protein
MKLRLRHLARDERGQSLAVMAVMAAALLAMLSLSIDLGMLYTARSEAQRAAEAAALAGAQEFMNPGRTATASAPFAHDSAMAYALNNTVRNIPITASEVMIAVDIALQKVSVRIDRDSIPLWFARLVGRQVATVNAHAAARAAPAGSATCVLPFAVPDIWHETPAINGGDDTDGNRIWDTGEQWAFGDDIGDSYVAYTSGGPTETGYGSAWRNNLPIGTNIVNDYGRPMVLKVQDPTNSPVSGFFYPFRHVGTQGANDYRDAIEGCNQTTLPLNAPTDLEMGNMKGPTRQGVDNLVAQDPTATWDTQTNQLVSPLGFASPRVRIIPLYDPYYITQVSGGNHTLTFNNFAVLFVEGVQSVGNEEFVLGRFLYYAQGQGGAGPGGATGSLVRILQLVE